jgi:hypothetical protein
MGNLGFSTKFSVNQTPEEVYRAINDVSNWWQGEIVGKTDKLNEEFIYRMGAFHYSKQKVITLIPFQKITWLITDSNLNSFGNSKEWNGTEITFDISIIENITEVIFTHHGLIPAFECYSDCSNAWGELVQQSLYSLITTGKGKKVF